MESSFIILEDMSEDKILRNRVINSIESIKYKLKASDSMPIFNDMIILKLIVMELPKETLRNLLRELKQLAVAIDGPEESLSIAGVLELLSLSTCDSPLLEDFLKCAGYQLVLTAPSP